MKYLSLFSGIGGFELGIQQAHESNTEHAPIGEESKQEERTQGRERSTNIDRALLHTGNRSAPLCVGYSEIDKYATQIYQSHFPEHKNYGDITKINADELPDFDILVGGFPCQAFSIAGKRGGFNDTRGTLFFEIARILSSKRPRLFLLENVKGLLSHDGGRTFRTIIATIDELGYDTQWQVLNSKNHGVPQNRERVFIVGHLRGTSRPEVFPFGTDDTETIERGVHTGTLTSRYPASQREGTYIEENGNGGGEIVQINNPTHSNDRVYGTGGVSPTLNTMQGGNRQPKIVNPLKGKTDYGWHFEQNVYSEDSQIRTLKSSEGSGNKPKVMEGIKIRRLTPVECERLQGFPDNWTAGVSDTQRYKTLGNAVTVNVIADIMERLL